MAKLAPKMAKLLLKVTKLAPKTAKLALKDAKYAPKVANLARQTAKLASRMAKLEQLGNPKCSQKHQLAKIKKTLIFHRFS